MIFPDEKVAEVCRLGPSEGAALLNLARSGDLYALAGVVVRGVYKQMIRLGASPVQALHHTRVFFASADLRPKVTI